MTLWTIQPFNLYKKLLVRGVLHCDPENEEFQGKDSIEFKNAYDWIVKQMKLRVGLPTKGVQYPFWAWALLNGLSKKPDFRRTEFNNYSGENVVLELEIPDADVLLSDFDNWHCVLNDRYLHDVKDEEGKWEENDAWFDELPANTKNSVKRKSWEKIFNKDDSDNCWNFVQATFWELRADQIKSIRKFTGRKKQRQTHSA